MIKKDEEVALWIEKELAAWGDAMQAQESDQTAFFLADLQRVAARTKSQETAYRRRELQMASSMDDKERDSTREQVCVVIRCFIPIIFKS